MSTPTITADLVRLEALYEWAAQQDRLRIAGKPSEWVQSMWSNSCGTACCIAGKVALEDGGKPVVFGNSSSIGEVRMPNGYTVDISEYAATALGLTDHESEMLFGASNDLGDLRAMIDAIAAGTSEDYYERVYCGDEYDGDGDDL